MSVPLWQSTRHEQRSAAEAVDKVFILTLQWPKFKLWKGKLVSNAAKHTPNTSVLLIEMHSETEATKKPKTSLNSSSTAYCYKFVIKHQGNPSVNISQDSSAGCQSMRGENCCYTVSRKIRCHEALSTLGFSFLF